MTTLTTGPGATVSQVADTSGAALLALFTGSTPSGPPSDAAFTVQTAGGLRVSMSGAFLGGYGTNGLPAFGLIASVSIRTAAGDEILALTNLLVSAPNLSGAVATANAAALNHMFFAGNDTLLGSAYADVLVASNGADVVGGRGGDDTLDGGDGDDSLDAGEGNDTVLGGRGRDTLEGDVGNDSLDGGADADRLFGEGGNDVLRGGAGADTLFGGPGDDTVEGGDGDDRLEADAGNDTLEGGDGIDTLSFANATTAVVASVLTGTATAFGLGTDTFSGIESLIGGSGDDELTGGSASLSPSVPNLLKPSTLSNDSRNPFSLDGSFDLDADAHVTNATFVPHATVYARAASSGYFNEFYSFTTTTANSTVVIDIDATDPGFDAVFFLYRLDGFGNYNFVEASYGSVAPDPGSSTTADPYLTRTLAAAATYAVMVLPSGSTVFSPYYTLHVSVDGGVGRAMLDGGEGNDVLNGGAAAETLIGGFGADTVDGGGGNDLVIARSNALVTGETMAGGDGTDLLRLVADLGTTTIHLEDYAVSGFEGLDIQVAELTMTVAQAAAFGSGLTIVNSRSLSAETVHIVGAQAVVDLSGWTLLNWEGFRDVIVIDGTSTATAYIGSAFHDQVDYALAAAGITASLSASVNNTGDAAGDTYVGIEQLNGTAFGDVLSGDAAVNALQGGAGNDLLYGYEGADNLYGGAGDDILEGGAGADFIDGGEGFDTVSYAASAGPVVRAFGSSVASGAHAVGDVLFGIEALSGSAFADILAGAGSGDTLSGGFGSDWLLGQGGADTLRGEAGNDVLLGGDGADRLEGGLGDDVAHYRDATAGVGASLAAGGHRGEALGDSYVGIENLWGSDFGDTLTGDASANQVYGFAGVDVIDGAGGDDTVYGGAGADALTGGGGDDTFYYLQWQTDGGDTLTDFTSGADRVMVSRFWFGIDSAGAAAVIQPAEADFITSGGSTSTHPSFLWNSATGVLSFDPDGLGGTPGFVLATLQAGASLTPTDIWSS